MSEEIKEYVKNRYSEHAIKAQSSCTCGCSIACCGPTKIQEIGYELEELLEIPETAVLVAAGCGNPTAIADLKKGEIVLDLGSGGGIDAILAAKKVGSKGKVIGVDMTEEMIKVARKNAEETGLENLEFRLGDIEELPVCENSVDVIISNCVINLAPDKDKVFQEAFRVLKTGGRIVVSDIVTETRLPEHIRKNLDSWAGCVGGAIEHRVYMDKLKNAGFTEVQMLARRGEGPVFSAEIQGVKPDHL